MSESEEPPDQLFSLSAYSDFEGDDEALEALVQVKELDFGEVFNSRDTQLDTGEGESIMIQFYHDDMFNSLNISGGNESDIMITLNLTGEDINKAGSVLKNILDCIGGMTIETVNLYKTYDVPFASLQLPIEDGTDHYVTGLRIERDEREYIIQQQDDDETSVNMLLESPEGDAETIVNNIGEEAINSTTEFVESLY